MSNSAMIKALREVRSVAEGSVAYDQAHIDALDTAIRDLDNRTDRDMCAAVLFLAGLVLGAVAAVSAVGGLLYALMGDPATAGAMLPYVVLPAVLAMAALHLAGR